MEAQSEDDENDTKLVRLGKRKRNQVLDDEEDDEADVVADKPANAKPSFRSSEPHFARAGVSSTAGHSMTERSAPGNEGGNASP